jgi:outer membrane protein
MRKIAGIAMLLLSAAPVGSAQAPPTPVVVASPAQQPPTKVGTIFGQNAITSTQEGQKASAALTVKFAPKREEYNRKQTELQALQDQLRKGQTTLSSEAHDKLAQSIEAKTRELKRLGEDSQDALEQDEGAMMQQLSDKMVAVLRDYATRNGYAVIIDVSLPNGPVLWASPSIDITNEIVKLYDKAHPVPATPTAAPAKK